MINLVTNSSSSPSSISCQIINTSNANLTANNNKKIDELNSLLMSQLQIDEDTTQSRSTNNQNLTNLRDVLKAAHKMKLTNKKKSDLYETFQNISQQQHQSLASLIEILKFDNNQDAKTDENNLIKQPQFIINKIENDLQESLKLLKQYNLEQQHEQFDEKIMLTQNEDLFRKRNGNKYSRINEEEEENDDSILAYNFNRNDLIRKNIFNKAEYCAEKAKKQNFMNQECDNSNISLTSLRRFNNLTHSPTETNQRRNSIDHLPYSNNCAKTSPLTKSTTTSQFNQQIFNTEKSTNDEDALQSSGFWNYDELNELKMKFISLLSDNSDLSKNSSSVESYCADKNSKNENVYCMVNNCEKKLSSMSFVSIDMKPISSIDQLKIESFYRSFGTSLYISQACASLYTIPNFKLRSNLSTNQNRLSIATTTSIKFSNDTTNSLSSSEINHDVIKDLMKNRYEAYVPVYHRGVPLWLLNSGKNPRRPTRQLKFTLAEKGTGFILWQDRIDSYSDFNMFLQRKNESTLENASSNFDSLKLLNEIKQNQIESMLVTFRASDKKTTVFMKLDISAETVKFFDYYQKTILSILIEIKQKTKSLPVGLGNPNLNTKLKRTQKCDTSFKNRTKATKSATNTNIYACEYNLFDNNSRSSENQNRNKNKRRSCHIGPDFAQVRLKKITKNDISNPCNYKHIINLKQIDKNSYYTLSKLLPVLESSTSSNTSNQNSTPSPCYSLTSSSSTTSASSYMPSHNSAEVQTREKSNLIYTHQNRDSLPESSSSSCSSSISAISPSLTKIAKSSNKFFETCSFNQRLSQQKIIIL